MTSEDTDIDFTKQLLRHVGAMDADGEGMTVTGLNAEQRAALVAKLEKAMAILSRIKPAVEAAIAADAPPTNGPEARSKTEELNSAKGGSGV